MSDVTPEGRPRPWPYEPSDVIPDQTDRSLDDGETPDRGEGDEGIDRAATDDAPDTSEIGYTTPTGDKEPTA